MSILGNDLPAVMVAAAQFSPSADKSRNLQRIERVAARAAEQGAQVLVLPEYSSFFTFPLGMNVGAEAETLDGPFCTAIRELSRRYGIALVAGIIESITGSGGAYNTVIATDAVGDLVARYRKVHLFDAFGYSESDYFLAGDPAQRSTFDIDGLTVGIQTCYDLRFPESTRQLALAGAHLVVIPAEWVPGPNKEHHWRTLLAARAIENTCFVMGVGQTGPGGIGHSMAVDPEGVVLFELGRRPGMWTTSISPSAISAIRDRNPTLNLRRFDVHPREGDLRGV